MLAAVAVLVLVVTASALSIVITEAVAGARAAAAAAAAASTAAAPVEAISRGVMASKSLLFSRAGGASLAKARGKYGRRRGGRKSSG